MEGDGVRWSGMEWDGMGWSGMGWGGWGRVKWDKTGWSTAMIVVEWDGMLVPQSLCFYAC